MSAGQYDSVIIAPFRSPESLTGFLPMRGRGPGGATGQHYTGHAHTRARQRKDHLTPRPDGPNRDQGTRAGTRPITATDSTKK
ncbi:hypothetical protein GCM10027176_12950 [Actinoallomurus bryophytorum]